MCEAGAVAEVMSDCWSSSHMEDIGSNVSLSIGMLSSDSRRWNK